MRPIFRDPSLELLYREKGYVVIDLLDDLTARRLLSAYRSVERDAGVPFFTTTWFEDVDYRKETDALIRRAAADRLRSIFNDYDLLYASFIVKKRGLKKRVGLHADWQFVHEPEFAALNVWIALESIDAYSGSLQVVPGSHLRVDQLRGPNYRLDPAMEQYARSLRSVPLAIGQAILYDTRLLHASNPNLFKASRVVASALMVPSEAAVKYFYFDPSAPEEPQFKHDVPRDFYLEKCIFNRTVHGWAYAPPEPVG